LIFGKSVSVFCARLRGDKRTLGGLSTKRKI